MSKTEVFITSSDPSNQLLPFELLRLPTVGSHMLPFSHTLYTIHHQILLALSLKYPQRLTNFSLHPLVHVIVISHLDYSALFSSSPPSVFVNPGTANMPDSSVLHYLPEFAKIHVH